MKLIIRNIDRNVTEPELMALFSEYGVVQYCNLVLDTETGESKGFGFVEMPKVGDAKAAIMHLNDKLVGENRLRVKKANP
jgi:RNA recognition motif-containing protein